MRNTDRIDTFLQDLGRIWEEHFPDWRFGQLIFNFVSVYGDPFHLEEDEFLVALKAYVKGENPRDAVFDYAEKMIAEDEAVEKKKEDDKPGRRRLSDYV